MTVCVAAMCELTDQNPGGLVGAWDHMLTVGEEEVTYEPNRPKGWWLTERVMLMTAGDDGLQSEIFYEVWDLVYGGRPTWDLVYGGRPTVQPEVSVKQAADFYVATYLKRRQIRMEREVLAPIALTVDTFYSKQKDMAPEIARLILDKMDEYEPPGVETLVAGVDLVTRPDGSTVFDPHIYTVLGGVVTCQDQIGFAAVGSGGPLAESEFIAVGHTRQASFSDTLLRTYSAKKSAEANPFVGTHTDMSSLLSSGKWQPVGTGVIDGLERIHAKAKRAESRVAERASKEIQGFVEKLREQQKKS